MATLPRFAGETPALPGHYQIKSLALKSKASYRLCFRTSKPFDGFCLWTFRPLNYFKLDDLALLQRLVPVSLYRRVVHEHVCATRLLDEPVTLCITEPLDRACDIGIHPPPNLQRVSRAEQFVTVRSVARSIRRAAGKTKSRTATLAPLRAFLCGFLSSFHCVLPKTFQSLLVKLQSICAKRPASYPNR